MVLRKKERLARFLMKDWVTALLARRQKNHLSLLAYHSVQEPVAHYPYNTEIISAYPNIFEQQMAFITRHFNVLTFSDLVSYGEGAPDFSTLMKRLPSNSLIVTFDDGYADNLTIAMPIMQAYDVRAVIYIATDFIDQQKLFWFDRAAYIFRKLPDGNLTLMDGRFKIVLDKSDRESQRRAFGRFAQTLSDPERREVLEELRSICGFTLNEDEFKYAAPLTWDQVRLLRSGGMEIGSHTRGHGFLDVMTQDELVHEIKGSKQRIEEQLGEEVISFSYPNGNFNSDVIDVVKKAGYQFAVAYDHDIARLGQVDPFLIPRIHIETDVSISLFKANLMLPEIFV